MKIGIAASEIFSTNNGTRERVAKELIKALMAIDGKNSFVLFSKADPSPEFRDNERLKNVKVSGKSQFIWDQFALPKALKREKCEVLLNLGITGPLNPHMPFLYILPYFWGNFLWDSLYGFGNFSYNKPSMYERFVSKRLIYSCSKLILSTHYEKDNLVMRYFKDIPAEKLTVIQAGVNKCESDGITDAEIDAFRSKYGISEKYILMIGSPNPLSNIQAGILGYKRMVKELTVRTPIVLIDITPDIVESLVGSEWFQDNRAKFIFLKQPSSKERSIVFKMASLFMVLSFYEKWCLNIMEAIACGIPIVTTINSSLSEIAQGAAILVDPKNPVEVSEAGRLVLIDKRCVQGLSKVGVERSMVYQWSNSARKLIVLLENIK